MVFPHYCPSAQSPSPSESYPEQPLPFTSQQDSSSTATESLLNHVNWIYAVSGTLVLTGQAVYILHLRRQLSKVKAHEPRDLVAGRDVVPTYWTFYAGNNGPDSLLAVRDQATVAWNSQSVDWEADIILEDDFLPDVISTCPNLSALDASSSELTSTDLPSLSEPLTHAAASDALELDASATAPEAAEQAEKDVSAAQGSRIHEDTADTPLTAANQDDLFPEHNQLSIVMPALPSSTFTESMSLPNASTHSTLHDDPGSEYSVEALDFIIEQDAAVIQEDVAFELQDTGDTPFTASELHDDPESESSVEVLDSILEQDAAVMQEDVTFELQDTGDTPFTASEQHDDQDSESSVKVLDSLLEQNAVSLEEDVTFELQDTEDTPFTASERHDDPDSQSSVGATSATDVDRPEWSVSGRYIQRRL